MISSVRKRGDGNIIGENIAFQESQRFEHPKINLDGKELKYIKTPQACNCVLVHSLEIAKIWTLWELNPRPFTCEAKIIPLDQAPETSTKFYLAIC